MLIYIYLLIAAGVYASSLAFSLKKACLVTAAGTPQLLVERNVPSRRQLATSAFALPQTMGIRDIRGEAGMGRTGRRGSPRRHDIFEADIRRRTAPRRCRHDERAQDVPRDATLILILILRLSRFRRHATCHASRPGAPKALHATRASFILVYTATRRRAHCAAHARLTRWLPRTGDEFLDDDGAYAHASPPQQPVTRPEDELHIAPHTLRRPARLIAHAMHAHMPTGVPRLPRDIAFSLQKKPRTYSSPRAQLVAARPNISKCLLTRAQSLCASTSLYEAPKGCTIKRIMGRQPFTL